MADKMRYARQVQLEEVGAKGQEELLASTLFVPKELDETTLQMAELYANGSGIGHVQVAGDGWQATTLPFDIRSTFRHESARAVGEGAALVLQHALFVLGLCASNEAKESP